MTEDNRRKFRRLPCAGEKVVVEADGRRVDCEVLDQSIGGFRIIGIDPLMLDKGQPLSITYQDEVIDVSCVNVSRMEDGKFSIGVARTRDSSGDTSSSEGSLINPYVRLEADLAVLCRVVEVLNGSQLKIEFPGGTQCDVAANAISAMSREERRLQLGAQESLSKLIALYSENALEPTIGSILNFEYGD